MEKVILDCEVYSNFFLCVIKRLKDSTYHHFEIYENNISHNFHKLKLIMQQCEIISFNGLKYDYPIIKEALNTKNNQAIKTLSDDIIINNVIHWADKDWASKAIDIVEPSPAVMTGLKVYEARMHFHNLQDLPIEPNKILTTEECKQIKTYCINDIEATQQLYETIKPSIDLRQEISNQIGVNVKSKSDAQIAESIFKYELSKYNINTYRDINNICETFKYTPPSFIKFKSKELQEFFDLTKNIEFLPDNNGKINLPKEISKAIGYKGNSYKFGIGGIHDTNTEKSYYKDDSYSIIDVDVTSYYPSIIINNGYYPKNLSSKFLDVYTDIYNKRLKAKKDNNKIMADTFKITLNGSYGKFGSRYSFLYSPDLLIHTTLTGQLSLLMLIEKLEDFNINVISANTDGLTCKIKNSDIEFFRSICKMWEEVTNFNLEETHYKSIHIRDVNNYIAITSDNKLKRKGCFGETTLTKNPSYQIIYDAICDYLQNNTSIEQHINNSSDITKFLNVRRVTGGGIWKGKNVGKVVRWFKSPIGESIHYIKNNNKVATSDNAYVCLDLKDVGLLDKVDRQWYIDEAYKVLKQLNIKEVK